MTSATTPLQSPASRMGPVERRMAPRPEKEIVYRNETNAIIIIINVI
jgi:hypothetical protein